MVYNNDGNAAALYAHHSFFGAVAGSRSSVSAIVGTGLGGGVIEAGRIVKGAAGMAGSWATSTSRWTGCSGRASHCRTATADSAATSRASPP